MKASTIRILSFVMVGFSWASSASALPPWKPKFQEMFVDEGPQSLKDAFANSVIGSCKVCHVNGEEKTVRNPFGLALEKRIEGEAGQRLKTAAEKGDEAKAAMQAKLDKEYLAALAEVLELPSPSGGGTFGQRIKAGQLPFLAAPNQLTGFKANHRLEPCPRTFAMRSVIPRSH